MKYRAAFLFLVLASAVSRAQERRVAILTQSIGGRELRISATDLGLVHVLLSDIVLPVSLRVDPGCSISWANTVDSIAAIPAKTQRGEEIRFPAIWMLTGGPNLSYKRVANGDGKPQHWLYYRSDEGFPSYGIAMTAAQLRASTNAMRSAATRTLTMTANLQMTPDQPHSCGIDLSIAFPG